MFVFKREWRMQKTVACKDEKFYKSWCESHKYCHLCGVPASKATWPGLSTHHIIKPGRSHEPCNLIRACHVCHRRCEGEEWIVRGVRLPIIGLGAVLTVKAMRGYDKPEEWNPERLMRLYGRALPDLEDPPLDIELSYSRWRPKDQRVLSVIGMDSLCKRLGLGDPS